MAKIAIRGQRLARCAGVVGFVGAVAALCAAGAAADVCQYNGNTIPQCVVQTDTGSLSADKSEYMNVYCPSNANYAWGSWSDSWSSIWHVITRNPVGDNLNSLDFLLTNTKLGTNHWSISIGCSPISPNGQCSGATKEVPDPGCPESNRQTECQPADNCWVTWNEQCVNNNVVSNYYCTQVLFVTTCFSCESTSSLAASPAK